MRTTLVIDDRLIEEGMRATGAKTKRELVERGLRELIRARNRELLRSELGRFKLGLTAEELRRVRSAD